MLVKKMIVGAAFISVASFAQAQNDPEPRTIGGNKDSHGCYTSAGYVWSTLQKQCIRTFETGKRMDPVASNPEQSLSAFVVTLSETNLKKVEVFMPIEKASIILVQQGKKMVWNHAKYTLSRNAAGAYSLKTKAGKELYKG